jgi:nitroreductase
LRLLALEAAHLPHLQSHVEELMDVTEAIRTLRSVRQFTDQPLADDALRAILDAGHHAQSSKNSQPWTFIAIRDRETLRRLSECGDFAQHLASAAAAIALVSPNPTGFDLGQATTCIQLAAWDRGIGSCIAWMHRADQAKAALGVPSDHTCDIVLSLGYPTPEELKRPLAPAGQGRKPFDDVVRWEHY